MHCFLYHLYDIGMRVKLNDKIIDQEQKVNSNKSEYFDAAFANICQILKQKKSILSNINGLNDRIAKQEKFLIELNNDPGNIRKTDSFLFITFDLFVSNIVKQDRLWLEMLFMKCCDKIKCIID